MIFVSGYAALPKLMDGMPAVVEGSEVDERLTQSAEELLEQTHLPSQSDEAAEEKEIQALEEKLRQLESDSDNENTGTSASYTSSQHSGSGSSQSCSSQPDTPPSASELSALQKWHANLEQRLYPFWSTALSNRTLRIAVYCSDPSEQNSDTSPPLDGLDDEEQAMHKRPIVTKEIMTSADGSFTARFTLNWETICHHPGALHIAFGDPGLEHELFVSTQLMPAPSRPSTPATVGPASAQYFSRPPRITRPTVTATLSVPLTHTTIRVISDIDDTIKLSGILQGARAAFRNVFVKDLGESIIPGMADWYASMWKRGVRFHYVVSAHSLSIDVLSNISSSPTVHFNSYPL